MYITNCHSIYYMMDHHADINLAKILMTDGYILNVNGVLVAWTPNFWVPCDTKLPFSR